MFLFAELLCLEWATCLETLTIATGEQYSYTWYGPACFLFFFFLYQYWWQTKCERKTDVGIMYHCSVSSPGVNTSWRMLHKSRVVEEKKPKTEISGFIKESRERRKAAFTCCYLMLVTVKTPFWWRLTLVK